MLYSRSSYQSLPSKPGVYVYLDAEKNVLYVGKAKDLKSRVSSYFTSPAQLGEKTKALVSQINKINITIVESELEALLLEAYYIKKYNPKYNIRLTDNKAYVLVRISNFKFQISNTTKNSPGKDFYPKVLLARRADDPNSIYFGPFPSSREVKLVLKTIRRVFPFVSVRNHAKRICLYHHLGLCPCPPVFDSPELRKQYKKNITNFIRIFEGSSQKIMKELEKERDKASNEEHFETALLFQKKIQALGYITQPTHRPQEYDLNPNLRTDLRQHELDSLKKILNDHGCPVVSLDRIECYDISHVQGAHTVASMVVFEHGEKESSQYRKFKIRKERFKAAKLQSRKATESHVISNSKSPQPPLVKGEHEVRGISLRPLQRNDNSDDFASMQEVLSRRFTHPEWDTPGLIIIDGGKGQVSAAMAVLEEIGLNIPLIGLAKREETIVIPVNKNSNIETRNSKQIQNTNDQNKKRFEHLDFENLNIVSDFDIRASDLSFNEVSLPHDTKALQLLQRIRDEAHRFAITYHRKLRSKAAVGK